MWTRRSAEFRAVVSGPLAPDEAIRLVDDRASEARERFEQIRSEMSGRAAAANLVRKDAAKCDFRAPDGCPSPKLTASVAVN